MGSAESAEPNRFFAQFAAFVALAVGLFVFAGWTFDIEPLTNLVPGWPRMSRLTALEYVSAGVALWLATVSMKRSAAAVSLLVTAIGLLVLFRYALSWDAYIDQLTFAPMPDAERGVMPPRMAPSTAVAFCGFGMSIL